MTPLDSATGSSPPTTTARGADSITRHMPPRVPSVTFSSVEEESRDAISDACSSTSPSTTT